MQTPKGNILETVTIIPGRFVLHLVEENGTYSVYHYLDGGHGQRNCGTNRQEAEKHLYTQSKLSGDYKTLIGKRDRLTLRIAPISNKLDQTTRLISALILS